MNQYKSGRLVSDLFQLSPEKNEATNKKNDVPPITWALPSQDYTCDNYTEVWHRSSVFA